MKLSPRRISIPSTREHFQRLIAVGMIVLVLPLAQIDALAQQGYPQEPPLPPNPYIGTNQYAKPSPYRYQGQPDPQQLGNQYAAQAPGYAQQQPYQSNQYANQDPGQYQGQYPDRNQPQDQAQYPPQYAGDQGAGQNPTYGSQEPYAQQQSQQAFQPDRLEQMVAPIALYPDTLIAQILAAATYPAQVVAADHWVQAQGYAAPDQIAAGADAQPTWDPSVKALTAFPQVLTMLDRDLEWTTDLGNAYYNQPQDVLQTIQVLRQRAESAGTLQNTPQEQVSDDQGYIQLAPANPQVVYVPAYNPWYVYGAPIAPYRGFSLVDAFGSVLGPGLRFGAGIAMGAFAYTSFGWTGWALNWLSSSIFFHQSPYYSRSTSVARWGNPGGGNGGRGGGFPRPQPMGRESSAFGRNQGEYNRPSNGNGAQNYGRTSNNYARAQGEYNRPSNAYGAGSYGRQSMNGYGDRSYERQPANGYGAQGYARQPGRAAQDYGYNRPSAPTSLGYGNYGRPQLRTQPQAALPSRGYSQYPNPQQSWRPAQPAPQRSFPQSAYDNRSYGTQSRSYSAYSAPRGFAGTPRAPERSGGFHAFGSNHGGESYHAPKAPKFSSGGGHGGGGGFFHHSGGGDKRR